jgi:hypothetical protein
VEIDGLAHMSFRDIGGYNKQSKVASRTRKSQRYLSIKYLHSKFFIGMYDRSSYCFVVT